MVNSVSDLALLSGVAAATWQIVGGWYKFRASKNKRIEQLGPFESLNQVLKAAAAKGDRPTADWGRGATESGHGNVIAGWNTLSADARVGLVDDLIQIALLTGQLGHVKSIRKGRTRWSQMSNQEQAEILAALDSVTYDGLGRSLKDQAAQLGQDGWLWQVTEPVPMLAEELPLSEPCTHELTLLQKAFDKADAAVKDVLGAERASHLDTLATALKPLDTTPATNTLKELKGLVSGPLASELGSSAVPRLSQQLRDALSALVGSDDGLVARGGAAAEAARKLEAQAEAKASERRLEKERSVAMDARAMEVGHILEVAGSPSSWLSSVSLSLKLALVELVLTEIAACNEGDVTLAALTDTAKKLITKLPISGEATEKVQNLLKELSGIAPAAPAGEGEDASAAPPAAPRTVPEAAHELSRVLEADLKDKLAPTQAATDGATEGESESSSGGVLGALTRAVAGSGSNTDASVVSSLVHNILANVVINNTPGGLVAVAASGSPYVTRGHVVSSVKTEAARRAEAKAKPALEKIASQYESLKSSALSELLTSHITQAEKDSGSKGGAEGGDAEPLTAPQKLALAAAYIQNIVLTGQDSALSTGAKRALSLLDGAAAEAAPLSSGAAASVAHALELSQQLTLVSDVSSKLELGPGLVGLLDRLDAFCDAAEKTGAAKALPNGHANGHCTTDDNDEETDMPQLVDSEGNAKQQQEDKATEPETPVIAAGEWAKARGLIKKLLSDGIPLLELSPNESRKLSGLCAAVDGCQSTLTDAVVFNRHLTTLKDLSTQLGPIMTALDTKISSQSDSTRQASLTSLRTSAVDSYKALQALLSLEHNMRTNSLDSLGEIKDIVYGLKLLRSSDVLETGLNRLEGVKAKAESVMGWVAGLQGSEDAVSEVMVMEEQVDRLVSAVRVWSDWVRLREGALGVTPASPAALEEDAELSLLPIEELQEMHRTDCIFIDPYDGVGCTSENLQDEDTLSPQTTTNSRAPATATTGQQASSAGSTTKAQAANGNNTNAAANGGAAESGSEEGEGDGDEEEGETEEGEEEGEDLLLVDEVDVSDGRKKRVQEEDGAEGDDSEADPKFEAEVEERLNKYYKKGYQLIARGQVAVILLAGALDNGELRIARDVGLPSTKSPLQLFAERLLKVQQLSAAEALGAGAGIMRPLDWYIVLPKASHSSLTQFLTDNAYFGLQPSQVHLVSSDLTRPLLSADLRVCMEAPGKVAKSAPCSGDVWAALSASGHLSQLTKRGARIVEVHTVEDNIMVRPADPLFLGAFHLEGLDAAAKVVDPASLMYVYEGYANLVATNKAAKVEDVLKSNPLALYRLSPAQPKAPTSVKTAAAAANPANTPAFRMDRHMSDWVSSGIVPGTVSGVFVCGSEEEFAPVVGAPPVYIPPSMTDAVDHLLLLHTGWVQSSGGELEDEAEGVVEVSPLVSYAGEGLEPLVQGKVYADAYDLDLQGYAPLPGQRVSIPHVALTAPLVVVAGALTVLKAVAKATGKS